MAYEITLETFEQILGKVGCVVVNNQRVIIDPKRLQFNDANLSKYTEEEGGWYDYFGQRLAEAEAELQLQELQVDKIIADKFIAAKDDGGSDKLAEAKAKADPEVDAAKKNVVLAKTKVKMLQQHLRAWDKNHDNAQSKGHMLRKEIDKLNGDIFHKNNSSDSGLDDAVAQIIGASTND